MARLTYRPGAPRTWREMYDAADPSYRHVTEDGRRAVLCWDTRHGTVLWLEPQCRVCRTRPATRGAYCQTCLDLEDASDEDLEAADAFLERHQTTEGLEA